MNLGTRKQLLHRAESARAVFPRDGIGPGRVGIHNCRQPHGRALLRQLVVDASVVLAEGARAYDRYGNGFG
jgi:hypothetical protein